MQYNSAALQQVRGQKLLDFLNKAWSTFRKEEQYQQDVDDQYKRLAGLEEDKGIWTLTRAVRHPEKWVVAATVVIGVFLVLGYLFQLKVGIVLEVLLASCMITLSFVGLAIAYAVQMAFVAKLLSKKGVKRKNQTGVGLVSAILVTIILLKVGGLAGYIILYGLVGIYTALCWADIKKVHKKQHSKKQKQHFRKEDEEMALELSWRLKRLYDFYDSDEMAFARAMVPEEFQSSSGVGTLLGIMKRYAAYDLHSAIQDYYQEQHMQQMEAEAAAARRAQERAEREQRAQTEILKWQRRDNQWHNKEMQYLQEQQNRTLEEMRREQLEHNRWIERYYRDY